MNNNEGHSWKRVLTFDDQSESFALGMQAGIIWAKMETHEPFLELFCGEILELVQRMPQHKSYDFKIDKLTDGWYRLEAVPKPKFFG